MNTNQPSTFDLGPSLPWFYWGLAAFQSAHSIEEIAAGLWRWMSSVTGILHERIGCMPVLSVPERAFVLANLVIVTLMLAFSPFVFINCTWAWKAAAAAAVLETINGLGHITAALLMGGYFPGCISALGLVVFGVLIWGRSFTWKETK